jgi:hypothetical protein
MTSETRRQQEADLNFRSEKRSFGKGTRCLIPASHFFEFTAPTDPKQKQEQMAFHARGCILVLYRRHHPGGRYRRRRLLHHADDGTPGTSVG